MSPTENNLFTVSRLNHQIRLMLEANASHILLVGEISNFSRPSSGHWYFTLKDDSAQIRAAMFRGNNIRVNFSPANGMLVIVRANVTLYEPRGDYQLVVENIKPAGEGLLQQKFEALKNKLHAEGLFDSQLKKALPVSVKSIGVITSSSGAALQDILNVLKRRDPGLPVVIYPTMVQGQSAIEQIAQMIEIANLRNEVDVLIVARGGGSLEDLWCFNEERVARAIFASKIPIISGVGHETDFTIADFVADIRAPTPSAAAELVSRDSVALIQLVQRSRQRLQMAVDYYFSQQQQTFDHLFHRLKYQHPQIKITRQLMHLTEIQNQLEKLGNQKINGLKEKWLSLNTKLDAFNPYQIGLNRLSRLKERLAACDPTIRISRAHQLLEQQSYKLSQSIRNFLLLHQQKINLLDKKLYPATIGKLSDNKKRAQLLSQSLLKIDMRYVVSMQKNRLNLLRAKRDTTMEFLINQAKNQLSTKCSSLDALSPLKTLNRGYSVVLSEDKKRISSHLQVKKGQKIKMHVTDGVILTEVLSTEEIKTKSL
ncbi:exodeoxyribonuclease VII large subunit [Thorsellia kenyensis]